MKFVIYQKAGKFYLSSCSEWASFLDKYKNREVEKSAKQVSMELSMYNAIQSQPAYSHQIQAFLRDIYNEHRTEDT